MSDQGIPGSALGRPSINGEGRAVQLEDLLPTGRRSFDSGGEALIQLCATTRLGTVSPGEATAHQKFHLDVGVHHDAYAR